MDEDDYVYYRNDYWDEADDRRNRRRQPRRPMAMPVRAIAPWSPPRPVVVEQPRKGIRDLPTGVLAELATQVIAAFLPLPPAPNMTGDAKTDLVNLVEYQATLAAYAKRNEQLRTAGYVARLFV